MDATAFLGLEQTHNPSRWVLPVTARICNHRGGLFGGAGLGAAVAALESVTGRHTIWATAQYLSESKAGSTLDLDVTLVRTGRQVTQARVHAHHGDREILTVNAALAEPAVDAPDHTWASPPPAPPPVESPTRGGRMTVPGSIGEQLELRVAVGRPYTELDGTPGTARSAMWARVPGIGTIDAAALAVLGDWVPFGLWQALGVRGRGVSLDNTLRVVRTVSAEWVLCDVDVYAYAGGFVHGHVHLWSGDGVLLGSASQSAKATLEPPPPDAGIFS